MAINILMNPYFHSISSYTEWETWNYPNLDFVITFLIMRVSSYPGIFILTVPQLFWKQKYICDVIDVVDNTDDRSSWAPTYREVLVKHRGVYFSFFSQWVIGWLGKNYNMII